MQVAKVFKEGKTKSIEIPMEYLEGEEEVYVKKIGNAVVLIPHKNPWQSLFDSLTEFSDDFMENREQPDTQERESVF